MQDPSSRSVFFYVLAVVFYFFVSFCMFLFCFVLFFFFFLFGPLWVLISGLKPKGLYSRSARPLSKFEAQSEAISEKKKKKNRLDFAWKWLTKGQHNHITLTKDLHNMTENAEWKYIVTVTSRTKVANYISSYITWRNRGSSRSALHCLRSRAS